MYSIFVDEDNTTLEKIDLDDGMWHIHFDASCSNEGNKAGIILYSPVGKIHKFSYRLEFSCTNNVTKFEVLLLALKMPIIWVVVTLQFLGIPNLL